MLHARNQAESPVRLSAVPRMRVKGDVCCCFLPLIHLDIGSGALNAQDVTFQHHFGKETWYK